MLVTLKTIRKLSDVSRETFPPFSFHLNYMFHVKLFPKQINKKFIK